MDLEGDLGIDSIKRVEILAAVEEQAPGMPEVDPSAMAALRTLGQIVDYMQGLLGEPSATPPPAVAVASAPATPVAPATPSLDLHALMLSVVADKTGYPAEMLEREMDLEGDLGIDSIKRVEILAAVEEQAPGMPEFDASAMASLRTLGQIIEFMEDLMGTPSDAHAAPEPAAEEVVPPVVPALGRYVLEVVAAPAVGLAQPGLLGAARVEVLGGGPLGTALVEELTRRGLVAATVEHVTADAPAVVFLGTDAASESEGVALQRRAFTTARAVAPAMTERGGLFVTVQDSGGRFGRSPITREQASAAGLSALAKTAAQEWPTASLKAIDLERGGRADHALALALADELLLGGPEIEVGLGADGVRRATRSVAREVQAGSPALGGDDVVLVSGGARGVTAACVIEWARETGARFVLLGRTALSDEPPCCAGLTDDAALKRALLGAAKTAGQTVTPQQLGGQVRGILAGREVRATVEAVAAAGGQAVYRSADVTDPAALAAALEPVRLDWGPVTALVHGAGVLADRVIAEQTDEQFDSVFDTKVQGLRALLTALSDDSLKVLCVFSSVAARCGNQGQVAYAMANETLNRVACAEASARGGSTVVKSLGWGPWQGGMVTPQLAARFAALGVPMIPLAAGARMFVRELTTAAPGEVDLVFGGEPRPEALLSDGAPRPRRLEVNVSRLTHGYLAGHTIGGTVVVPVVLALEWFSRMARAFRPDLKLESLGDLQVLSGIKLLDFEGAGDRLVLTALQVSNGHGAVLALELRSPSGTLHYRASATLVPQRATAAATAAPRLALEDWNDAPIYGDVLFHEADFQVIDRLDGVSADGISGTLKGVRAAKWSWEAWETDVAALDGGLQLLLLWARSALGGAVLPMAIGQYRQTTDELPEGPIHCTATCRAVGSNRGLADVAFFDGRGARFAELRDVELILRPQVRPAVRA